MNPRRTQEQIGLFPTALADTGRIDAIRAQAADARDAAMALALRRSVGTVWRAAAAIGSAILSWPERRAAYADLRALSDRELADIGLARGDIPRVFDPDFRMPSNPANANQPAGSHVQAA